MNSLRIKCSLAVEFDPESSRQPAILSPRVPVRSFWRPEN
jgi:hypothetical protein